MENFRRPYFARSISEFWQRWHISLSTWFKDYLYIPLGGNHVTPLRWYFNIMTVFVVSGFWHGANWTFLVWGFLHGFYFIFGSLTQTFRKKLAVFSGLARFPKILTGLKIATTFTLVCIAWIFFRAESLADAWFISTHLLRSYTIYFPGPRLFEYYTIAGSLILLLYVQIKHEFYDTKVLIWSQNTFLRWASYLFLIWVILLFGKFGKQEFIYFQF
jgi:D-alanyl-lipoteichoic acid acyltransferase DltB (MBOAT superfamily)